MTEKGDENRRRWPPALVIGVGNRWRGDDGIGLIVAERVRARAEHLEAVVHEGDLLDLYDIWRHAALAVVVDAMAGDGAPGTIRRYDLRDDTLPCAAFQRSSHTFGLGDTVALARVVAALPARLVVYGVVGACFDLGQTVSPGVMRAADELVDRIVVECNVHA